MLMKLQNPIAPGVEVLMNDALGAIIVAIVIILASMLAGGILYVVIMDTVKRNIQK